MRAPPRDYSNYKARQLQSRAFNAVPTNVTDWLDTFPDTAVQWLCPWWHIQHVTIRSYAYCAPIASFRLATFYDPSHLQHQYREKQRVVGPVYELEPGPLTQNFLDNLVAIWPRRFIERHINRDGDLSTNDQYKE